MYVMLRLQHVACSLQCPEIREEREGKGAMVIGVEVIHIHMQFILAEQKHALHEEEPSAFTPKEL
jgi:hypothetical protein